MSMQYAPGIMALSIPLFALFIGLMSVLSTNWRKAKEAEYRAIMLQNMLDKGMTSDEIERVFEQVAATKSSTLRASCRRS